ncbi:A-type ATP synthase subunit C [Natronomonas pharaonis DSM 2160]|uniref:A-type ATP synthase subunit C n=1 Tax=Natronomonas pharaonis (strain ATCC 35678 / DSM 2160 / CIP 103997 / JCM 8858 / NBRC 14720 / NCIMB 2260 / Gabara) TaxID=348780 RepID=A0A1U7EUF9_NATPD|nr:V-type ATP synthase subunit C [Natronomonas pharaonis]CAI48604.1 A-type ATP synthase subunit C [Natronomonas pharaonis DSM 2160]
MNVETGGSSNYEYVIARVRSRRAKLFDEDDYRKLVRMGPGEIARFMEETEYETEMNALGTRHSGVDLIEYALNRNQSKHFGDLLTWADGSLYNYIANYLRKFDAWNVKTAIRGIYTGADSEDIEDDLIRTGEFSEQTLDRLLEATSMEELVEQLSGTIFGEPLEEALEEYEDQGVLVPLENAVDRAFFSHLLDDIGSVEPDSPKALYREFLEAEIDFRNLRNGLRIARSGADIDPSEYFIEGGQLFGPDELRQLAANTDELVARIRDSAYGDDLASALNELESADSLIQFEHALDAALLEYSGKLSNRYPLSVCPILAYILAKEREVENIRAIARGREAGLSVEEIENELVIQ